MGCITHFWDILAGSTSNRNWVTQLAGSAALLAIGSVGCRIHQSIQFGWICDLDAHDPALTERVGVHRFRCALKRIVDRDNFAADGHVQVRCSLDGLDNPKRFACLQACPYLWQLDKYKVRERTLRVICQA